MTPLYDLACLSVVLLLVIDPTNVSTLAVGSTISNGLHGEVQLLMLFLPQLCRLLRLLGLC